MFRRSMAAMAAVICLAAGPAGAAILHFEWTGTVYGPTLSGQTGLDGAGLFGDVGASLVGEAFVLRQTFNTANGRTTVDAHSYFLEDDFLPIPKPTPATFTSLTVKGFTASFTPGQSVFTVDDSEPLNEVFLTTVAGNAFAFTYIAGGTHRPFALEGDYDGDACVGYCDGAFSFGPPSLRTSGGLTPEHLTIWTSPMGVPEPGAWALMIVGFGLTGAGLRRRRAIFRPA